MAPGGRTLNVDPGEPSAIVSTAADESEPNGAPPRDEEQRLVAYVALLVAGMAVVGWFAWLVVSTEPLFAVVNFVLGSVVLVLLSIVLGPLAALFGDRRDRDWAVHARQLSLVLVAGTAAATAYMLLFGADALLVIAGTGVTVVAFWVVVPLAIGAIVTTTGRRSMHSVLIAWPATNVLALAAYVAPEPGGGIDFGGATVMALAEPFRTIGLLAVAGIVTLGPTLLGRVIHRFIRQRAPVAMEPDEEG